MKFQQTLVASLAIPLAISSVSLAQAPGAVDPGIRKDTDHQVKREGVIPVRASKLIGMEVYNRQDKHLGETTDIVLDSSGRKIGYVVVSYGGVMGMGDKLFAVPYRNIEYSSVNDSKVYVALNEQLLKSSPGFDPKRWPDKTDAVTYYKQVDEYFDNSNARTAGAQMDADRTTEVGTPVNEGLAWNRRLSTLLNADVQSPDGQKLGDIKDVVIDWNTGKVQYDVLSFGGIMGFGDKLFAIPAQELKTKPDSRELVLAISKDRLKVAPGFDKDNWPNIADSNWRKSNDQFYTPMR